MRAHLLKMMTGTSLAHALSFFLMPLITRLYSPFEMGDYALYVSITSIVGLLSNLRLDLAVVVAHNDEEAESLAQMATVSAFIVSFFTFLWLISDYGLTAFSALSAASVFFIGANQTLVNWFSRREGFSVLATRSVMEKLVVLALGLSLAFIGYTYIGLVAAQTLGLLASLGFLFWNSKINFRVKWDEGFAALSRFREFPLASVASSGLMVMALFLPSVLFAEYFDKEKLGQFNLAQRVFEIPIILIGYTFSTVYYQHAQKTLKEDRLALFWRTSRKLLMIFVPPILLVGFTGAYLFPILFGQQWGLAGHLALWLAPYTAIRLMFVAQGPLLYVERRLRLDLMISGLLFISQIGGFYLGLALGDSVERAVQCMTLLGALAFACGLGLIWRTLRLN